MFTKGQKKDAIRFTVRPPNGAMKVQVAGDFSKWQPVPMRKQKNGDYACIVPLKPGTYEYKFMLDGQWCVDPDNGNYALNPYGTLNSVATVA